MADPSNVLINGPNIFVDIQTNSYVITGVTLDVNPVGLRYEIHNASTTLYESIVTWLLAYCNKNPTTAPPLYAHEYSPITTKVINYLKLQQVGKQSYKDVAVAIGHPTASRAVGQACSQNKIPLFIPCHRVIKSDGKLGGFAFPLAVKQSLLDFEAGF